MKETLLGNLFWKPGCSFQIHISTATGPSRPRASDSCTAELRTRSDISCRCTPAAQVCVTPFEPYNAAGHSNCRGKAFGKREEMQNRILPGQSPFTRPPDAVASTNEDRRSNCLSLLERYERLRLGSLSLQHLPEIQESPETSAVTAESHSADTKEAMKEIETGELPVRGAGLHLAKETLQQLKRNRAGMEVSGISDRPLLPQRSLSESRGRDVYNLYEQNQEWLDSLQGDRNNAQSSEILYSPSDTQEAIPYSEHQSPVNCEEQETCTPPVDEGPSRLTEQDRAESLNRLAQCCGTDGLVALARRGEFSRLWEAIRTARTQLNTGCNEGHSVYQDAVESFLTEWSDFTTAKGLLVRKRRACLTVDDSAIGSSFVTCSAWFEDLSSDLDGCPPRAIRYAPSLVRIQDAFREPDGQWQNGFDTMERFDANKRYIAVIRRTGSPSSQQ